MEGGGEMKGGIPSIQPAENIHVSLFSSHGSSQRRNAVFLPCSCARCASYLFGSRAIAAP